MSPSGDDGDEDAEMGVPQSVTDTCADTNIFAARKGKTLSWSNISMRHVSKKGKQVRENKILRNVWGRVPAHSVTAILGPSGSGKTSLLNVLAGRVQSRGKIQVDGTVRLNEDEVDPTKISVCRQIAFVEQENSLQITSTPREAIFFSARLRLDRSLPNTQISSLVDEILLELGINKCADTMIGGGLIKGISGGEKKRTSVGVELVVRPAILFADEPTSGLDSVAAGQIVKVLTKVAKAGSSVLFTIHQPSSELFHLFDRLILLKEGRIFFQGEASSLPGFFSERGHPIPQSFNPADWALTIAQSSPLDCLEQAGYFPAEVSTKIEECEKTDPGDCASGNAFQTDEPFEKFHHVGMCTEMSFLFIREMKQLARNKVILGARFGMTLFFSFLWGLIFYGVGGLDPSHPLNLQSHTGAIICVLITTMMGGPAAAMAAFAYERPIFLREYSTFHYSVVSYFISHFVVEAVLTFLQILEQTLILYFLLDLKMNFVYLTMICFMLAIAGVSVGVFVGSCTEDPRVASEMFQLVTVPQMLFSGVFVSTSHIPPLVRWAQYFCSLTFAVRLSLKAEFGNCTADTCIDLLQANAVDELHPSLYWLILFAIFVGFRAVALLVLKKKATF